MFPLLMFANLMCVFTATFVFNLTYDIRLISSCHSSGSQKTFASDAKSVTGVVGVGVVILKIIRNSARLDEAEQHLQTLRQQVESSQAYLKDFALSMKERDVLLKKHEQFSNQFPATATVISDVSSKITVESYQIKTSCAHSRKGKSIRHSSICLT